MEIEWRCCFLVQLCNFHFEVFTASRETKRDGRGSEWEKEREAEGAEVEMSLACAIRRQLFNLQCA